MTFPFGRRAGEWSSVHERARTRAAERLWAPIDPDENDWLNAHLADCDPCRAAADAYATQRLELRTLRDQGPPPPRDLWARTAAAIEAAVVERGSVLPSRSPRARRRSIAGPAAAVASLLVVVVVVGTSLLAQPTPVPSPSGSLVAVSLTPRTTALPGATPLTVAAADLEWAEYGANGTIEIKRVTVDKVCPDRDGAGCAPVDDPKPRSVVIPEPPSTVVKAPDDSTIVVAGRGTVTPGGGSIYVVPVPTPVGGGPTQTPSAPPITPEPTPIVTPNSSPTSEPPVSLEPTTPVTAPPVETSSPSPASPSPTVEPTPSLLATPVPGGLQPILDNVILVGQSAAYSPDGTSFAFTARPSDGSQGPDVYVWRSGDLEARAVTSDHRSVFGAWLGDLLLASHAVPDPLVEPSPSASGGFRAVTFVLDPATGVETVLEGVSAWRPSVDAARRLAVYWDGTLDLVEEGTDWRPAAGRLVVARWPQFDLPEPSTETPSESSPPATPQSSALPGPSEPSSQPSPTPSSAPPTVAPTASASGEPSESPAPSASATPDADPVIRVLEEGRVRDWDARWDVSGTHVAVWIADAADPSIGRLSLFVVDVERGAVEPTAEVRDVQALPGFAISDGRLAWATPPGQDGQGSRVQIVAWTDDGIGSVETAPGDDSVLVIR